MLLLHIFEALTVVAASSRNVLWAQDLSPPAYVITPQHSNAVILTYSFYNGDIQLDSADPITNATGTYNVSVLTYYHGFGLFGRSANVTASLPYAVGNFQADVAGVQKQTYRSGLPDFCCSGVGEPVGRTVHAHPRDEEMETKDSAGCQPEDSGPYRII